MKETEQTTRPIVQMAGENDEFRKVVMTGEKMQVVLMAIPAGSEIGAETHEGHDQVLVFVEGTGKAYIGDSETTVQAGDPSFVPSGAHHNFVNDGDGPLKLYTLYAPPPSTRRGPSTPPRPRLTPITDSVRRSSELQVSSTVPTPTR